MYYVVVSKFPFLTLMTWLSFPDLLKQVSVVGLTSVQHLEEPIPIFKILQYFLEQNECN